MKRWRLFNQRTGAVAAAAAAATATAWTELARRSFTRADLEDGQIRVERLSDIKGNGPLITAVEAELKAEWGPFAYAGLASMDEMIKEAGRTIYVASQLESGDLVPKGCVQTMLADVHGDPAALTETYPTFADLTSVASWRRSRRKGGDTAVLLQITVFRSQDRGGGFGSLLRNALLNMLPPGVKYALTTTPIDSAGGITGIDIAEPKSYSPAMKFHARGGAEPSALVAAYKLPPAETAAEARHGTDIAFMKYSRDETGQWAAKRPVMRIRRRGPISRRAVRTANGIESVAVRGAVAILRPLRRISRRGPRFTALRRVPSIARRPAAALLHSGERLHLHAFLTRHHHAEGNGA